VKRAALAALAVVACGGKVAPKTEPVATAAPAADDCPQLVDKLYAALPELAKGTVRDKVIADCRKDFDAHGHDPMTNCIRAAATTPAVLACMGADAEAAAPAAPRERLSEAALYLNKIGKSMKRYFGETGAYPIGRIGPTPSQPCCSNAAHKCPWSSPTAKDWLDGPWKELEFAIEEPTSYQFTFDGDAKHATITAIGDPDCKDPTKTWKLEATLSSGGNPILNLTPP
jgi:hypothetical protein